ncbi:MAG: MerR family transcriptional regulator [Epulopiscium sp.]|jgi:DNA-binding transcriptional MerR regulator|nr:MerR family transcriptional regulator [Candidatus Epulonipiscium sp.]
MLKIGDFSKLSRISIRMLRHYDEIGLLVPKNTDRYTSYRYYSEEQLSVAGRITALKDMGFSLSTIREILKNYDNPEALTQYLLVKQTEMQEESEKISRRLLLLDTAIKRLRKDETAMNYNVTIKNLQERYVASLRQVIPAYEQEGILWNMMMQETARMHMQFAEPCYGMAVFHDEGHKESDVDVEIQISVKGTYENTEHVVFKTVPAVEFASAILKGSYEQLTSVHKEVAQWVRDNGYEFNGAMFCIYHVSPAQTQNPDELVTEICYPVKKK